MEKGRGRPRPFFCSGIKNIQVVGTPTATTYCIQNLDNTGYDYSKAGPQADILNNVC